MSYDAQIASAQRIIQAKGGLLTIRGTRQAALVPGTDRPSAPPTKLTASVKAVILPLAKKYIGADTFGDGTLMTAAHRMVLVAGADMPWDILQGDEVLVGTSTIYNIGGLNRLQVDPTGPVILYTLFLKN